MFCLTTVSVGYDMCTWAKMCVITVLELAVVPCTLSYNRRGKQTGSGREARGD